ncbi:hypothetical protein KVT40_001432 [Elsinoe batatas]|uniref:Uncharacterized protein n=1 Tax=Elsinoe batatas TaxID=2601811 RepID=A0A8K0LCR2_9PEZI|nr:hypothetical protein KVT40_001432 [Elsinoe batatas]
MFSLLQPNRPTLGSSGQSTRRDQAPKVTYLPPRPPPSQRQQGISVSGPSTACTFEVNHKLEPSDKGPTMPWNGQAQPPPPTMRQYNPALHHPVFFTSQLRRPPFPIPPFRPELVNPAATGYISNSAGAGSPKACSPRL